MACSAVWFRSTHTKFSLCLFYLYLFISCKRGLTQYLKKNSVKREKAKGRNCFYKASFWYLHLPLYLLPKNICSLSIDERILIHSIPIEWEFGDKMSNLESRQENNCSKWYLDARFRLINYVWKSIYGLVAFNVKLLSAFSIFIFITFGENGRDLIGIMKTLNLRYRQHVL